MADAQLSALTEVTRISGTDEVYVLDGTTSKRMTRQNLIHQTGGIWHPPDGDVGDSGSSWDVTSDTKFHRWDMTPFDDADNMVTGQGFVKGGIAFLRQVTDVDAIVYRQATTKSTGDASFCIYDLSDDGFPTGAPLWSHQLSSPTSGTTIRETGLTPFSLDSGWYFLGVWNWDNGGSNFAMRACYSLHGGPMHNADTSEATNITYDHSVSGAPTTLNGTETWSPSNGGIVTIGVIDSTS